MSKSVQAVSLNILGKEYKIACAVDEREALLRSAAALDQQMRKIRDTGKVAGADRIAVLAALNLAHDGGTSSHEHTDDAKLCLRLAELREKVEKALENP